MKFNAQLKQYTLIALMATASSSAFAAVTSPVGDGQIKFTGRIIADGCDVTINDGDITPAVVELGNVAAKSFGSVGSTSTPRPFTIKITGCPTIQGGNITDGDGVVAENTTPLINIQVFFSGNDGGAAGKFPGTTAVGTLLKIDGDGTGNDGNAKGVGIGIYNNDLTPLGLGVNSTQTITPNTASDDGTGIFKFYANYVSTAAIVGAGNAGATATFTIVYK